MTAKSVPLSAFAVATRFAIDPERIYVIESHRPGCIEVHLVNYSYDARSTKPGGTGLAIAGSFSTELRDYRAEGRYALVAGFDEVFKVVEQYESVVVLHPLGVGLGVRWEIFRQNQHKTSRKRRIQKKINSRASQALSTVRSQVARFTGGLPGRPANAPSGPYYLTETTLTAAAGAKRFSVDTPIVALTMWEAKIKACLRVAKLASQGWEVGEEASMRGTMQRANQSTVAFFCQRRGASKWVSIECGQAKPRDPEDMKYAERGESSFTVDKIVEARTTWAMFNGFSGESCGRCLAEANVLAGGPGWFCGCGHYNVQSWSCHQIPHEHPDHGPSQATIGKAYEKYRALTGSEY